MSHKPKVLTIDGATSRGIATFATLLAATGREVGPHDITVMPSHGPARPCGPDDVPCSLCGEHAADGMQDDRWGDRVPLCNWCAAPGRPLEPLGAE